MTEKIDTDIWFNPNSTNEQIIAQFELLEVQLQLLSSDTSTPPAKLLNIENGFKIVKSIMTQRGIS